MPSADASRSPSTGERAHAPALDGVRGIAVLLVMAHHWELPWHPFPVDLGLIGVRVFFVLSGFLITGILLDGRAAMERGESSMGQLARAFYARRALRIFPVYYGVLAVLLALDVAGVREQWGWHALYATSVLVARENAWVGLPSHFWSLSVEEHFYLLWPWAVLLAPRRALPWLCAAGLLAGPFWRGAGVLAGLGRFALLYTLPGCLDALGVGALLAVLHREQPALVPRARIAMAVVGALILVTASVLTASAGATPLSHVASATKGLAHALVMGSLVSACAGTASAGPSRLAAALSVAPLRHVGRVSYALYVVHPMVPYALTRLDLVPSARPLELAVYFALSLLTASASWRWFEAPVLAMKRRFPYARERARDEPATGQGAGLPPA